MFTDKTSTARSVQQIARSEDAVFIGWQSRRSGEAFALYNITAAGHPKLGSSIIDKSLVKANLRIPQTPLRPGMKPRYIS